MAEFFKIILKDYGIKEKHITSRNPQANGIVERIHQTIGNMIRTLCTHKAELDKDDPLLGILGAIMFATRTTVHTTTHNWFLAVTQSLTSNMKLTGIT